MEKEESQFDKDLEHIDWMPDQVRHDERYPAVSCGVVHSVIEKQREGISEEKRTVLRSRAKRLSQEIERERTDEEYLEILEFLLAQETYAIETPFIREVYPLTELTPLPCTPAFVFGLINIKGQILTVVDMKKFFDLPERGITNLNKVIVVRKEAMELGILADEIIGIRNIPANKLQPPLLTMSGIQADYLKGVTGERLIVLDMERFLTDRRLIVQEEVEP
jgi:purine-binding chemotaxis protein CheW